MYGYIYLTTNLVNGHKYVGKHKSLEFDLSYKGSGKLISRAFEKYGFDNFKVEILKECDSLEDLNQSEIVEISKRNAQESSEYYNIASGGEGWSSHWSSPGYKEEFSKKFSGSGNPFYGKHHTEESKEKRNMTMKERYENDPEHKRKISECQIGKHHSEETRAKISESVSKGKKGKLPLNNGERVIYRDPSEFEEYFKQGWSRGDLPRRKRSQDEIDRMRKSVSGLICVTNEITFRRVKPEEVQFYLDQGWRKGRPRR